MCSDANYGGSMAEWFRALDLKSGDLWFKSSTLLISGFVLGSPEFNSSKMCENSQLVSLPPVGVLSLSKVIMIIIIISIIAVFAGVLYVRQPGANHAPRASVTQVNLSVQILSTFLRIRADPSMQIF